MNLATYWRWLNSKLANQKILSKCTMVILMRLQSVGKKYEFRICFFLSIVFGNEYLIRISIKWGKFKQFYWDEFQMWFLRIYNILLKFESKVNNLISKGISNGVLFFYFQVSKLSVAKVLLSANIWGDWTLLANQKILAVPSVHACKEKNPTGTKFIGRCLLSSVAKLVFRYV